MEVQPPAVNPNLTSPPSFSYKDILVRKLVYAVACSVISQIIILLLYVIASNASIYPLEWIMAISNAFAHLSTWIFVLIFSTIIFAECLICSKDYVLMQSFSTTRFQQLCHIFSIHNFIVMSLHIITGGAFVWLILSIVDSSSRNLTQMCERNRTCLLEDTFFLIVGGLWTGFYYFAKVYMPSKNLQFPVVQQAKFLQFRTALHKLFKDSLTLSVWPILSFTFIYYFCGNPLENRFMSVFSLSGSLRESSVFIYVYSWWLSVLYFFSMNLMRFFFHLFLTEPVQFPLIKDNVYVLTLQEAIMMDKLPIIQHLACLDLFLLSQWSFTRRQLLFTLSQPGGHPHYWNSLVENVLKLFNEYADLLQKSIDNAPAVPKAKALHNEYTSPICPSIKYKNLRNMTLQSDYLDVVNVSSKAISTPSFDTVKNYVNEAIEQSVILLKRILGINFLFGELPQVNIQKCLGNGQLIVWACQGISELSASSLTEDKYGIVQKDLPVIVTSLVNLKQNLDKLTKVLSMSKKVSILDNVNYRMKSSVNAAVKHSLFNMCLNFGQYFNDFCLGKDVTKYLQTNVTLRS